MRTGAAGLPQQLYLGITTLVSVQQNQILWATTGSLDSEESRCVTVAARSTVKTWPSNKELSKNHRKINHNSVLLKKIAPDRRARAFSRIQK
jgi:hypothetical protein